VQIPIGFSYVFTEERPESGHTAVKLRYVECCSDVFFLSVSPIMEMVYPIIYMEYDDGGQHSN